MARYRRGALSWTCIVEGVRDDRVHVFIRVRFPDHRDVLREAGFTQLEEFHDTASGVWSADLVGVVPLEQIEELTPHAMVTPTYEPPVAVWLERKSGPCVKRGRDGGSFTPLECVGACFQR